MKHKLALANKELASQKKEKKKREAELIIANKELVFQNGEKGKLAAELIIANKELVFQNEEKEKRAAELTVANKELALQNGEKEKRAAEQIIANKELAFQNGEKEKLAAELIIANKELKYQNEEKEKREAELITANLELKKVEEKLIASENQVRNFAVHLNQVLEDERTSIAREVHDVLGQQITALKMDMSWLSKKNAGQPESVKEKFESMIAMTDEMVKSVRKISTQLRPSILDDLGLVAALEWQSTEFEKLSGIKCGFTA